MNSNTAGESGGLDYDVDNILTWSQDDKVAADEREILQDCENFISSLTEIEELLFSPRPD